jgi:hypothetical protein
MQSLTSTVLLSQHLSTLATVQRRDESSKSLRQKGKKGQYIYCKKKEKKVSIFTIFEQKSSGIFTNETLKNQQH